MSEQTLNNRSVKQAQNRRKAAADELYVGGLASFSLNRVAEANPEDIQSVGASNLCLLESFYTCVRNQSDESFRWALVAAGVGCAFFLFAVASLISFPIWFPDKDVSKITIVSLISGSIVEVIAGLNFYLYGRTSAQLASFHVTSTEHNAFCSPIQFVKR